MIFIAASLPRILEARRLRDQLVGRGFIVRARWLDDRAAVEGARRGTLQYVTDDEHMQYWAGVDFEDVLHCATLIQITGDNETRGGRHSEFGGALATGKRVILLGPREQIYHWHHAVRVATDLLSLLEILK